MSPVNERYNDRNETSYLAGVGLVYYKFPNEMPVTKIMNFGGNYHKFVHVMVENVDNSQRATCGISVLIVWI